MSPGRWVSVHAQRERPNLARAVNTLAAGREARAEYDRRIPAEFATTLNFTAPQNTKQRWPTARDRLFDHTEELLAYLVRSLLANYPRTPVYPGDPVQEGGFQSSYSTFSTGVDWTINSHLINQTNFGILNTQERAQPGSSFNAFQGSTFFPSASSFLVNGEPTLQAFTPPFPDNSSILPEPRNNPVWDSPTT